MHIKLLTFVQPPSPIIVLKYPTPCTHITNASHKLHNVLIALFLNFHAFLSILLMHPTLITIFFLMATRWVLNPILSLILTPRYFTVLTYSENTLSIIFKTLNILSNIQHCISTNAMLHRSQQSTVSLKVLQCSFTLFVSS